MKRRNLILSHVRSTLIAVNCYVHGSNEHNLRARLEDLIETEKRRAGKKFLKSDAPMTFSDGSRLMNGAIMVVRILGWAWRWADWWVEYGSTWEPLLEPGQKESKMSAAELRIVESSRVSRCDDARRCRLAAFGAALRNRCYDTEDGFDNASLDRALRAVLHTKSLVGPLELYEIDFFAEWLGRAYRSKSRLLGLGAYKIPVASDAFSLHEIDKSAKFELGDRPLPGKDSLPRGQIFEAPVTEPDDFLRPEKSEAVLETDFEPIAEVDYKHKGRKAPNIDAEESKRAAEVTITEYEAVPTKKARTASPVSARISTPSSLIESVDKREQLGMERGSDRVFVPPARDKAFPVADAEILYDKLNQIGLLRASNRRGRPPKFVRISVTVLVGGEYYDPRDDNAFEAAEPVQDLELDMKSIESEQQLENHSEEPQSETAERRVSTRKPQLNNSNQDDTDKVVGRSQQKRLRYSTLAATSESPPFVVEKTTVVEEIVEETGSRAADLTTQNNEVASSEMRPELTHVSTDSSAQSSLLEKSCENEESNQITADTSTLLETIPDIRMEAAKSSLNTSTIGETRIHQYDKVMEDSAGGRPFQSRRRRQSLKTASPSYPKPRRSAAPKMSMKEVDTDDDDGDGSDEASQDKDDDCEHIEGDASTKDHDENNSNSNDRVLQKLNGRRSSARAKSEVGKTEDVNSNSSPGEDDLHVDQIAEPLKIGAASRRDKASETRRSNRICDESRPKEAHRERKRQPRSSNVIRKDGDDLAADDRRSHQSTAKRTRKSKSEDKEEGGVTLASNDEKSLAAQPLKSRSNLTTKGRRIISEDRRKTDPLYVITSAAIAFLEGDCGIKTADDFINAKTSSIAESYAAWREKESLPKLAGNGAGATISTWKSKVREAAKQVGNTNVTNMINGPQKSRKTQKENGFMTKARKRRRSEVLCSEESTSSVDAESEGSDSDDECMFCHDGGDLLLCDGCDRACHLTCLDPPLQEVPEGDWYCPECTKKQPETKNDSKNDGGIDGEDKLDGENLEGDPGAKSEDDVAIPEVFVMKDEGRTKNASLELNANDDHTHEMHDNISTDLGESRLPCVKMSSGLKVDYGVGIDDQATGEGGTVAKDSKMDDQATVEGGIVAKDTNIGELIVNASALRDVHGSALVLDEPRGTKDKMTTHVKENDTLAALSAAQSPSGRNN